MLEWIKEVGSSEDWQISLAWMHALILLQGVDIFMGLLTSCKKKRLSSTIGWKGFTRKAATVGVIVAVGVIDPLIPVQLTAGAVIAYCGWEALSIVEKAGMLGVPIPKVVAETLSKLKESETPPAKSD
jgi:hypothetical protein